MSLCDRRRLMETVDGFRQAELRKEKVPFRLYNFAGNPMMCRMADGALDAVVELFGQKPHDVIPGASIALGAGATLGDLEGNSIGLDDFFGLLTEPDRRIRYIMASTPELYGEILAMVQG